MSMHRFEGNKWLVMNDSPGMDKLVDKACEI